MRNSERDSQEHDSDPTQEISPVIDAAAKAEIEPRDDSKETRKHKAEALIRAHYYLIVVIKILV